MDVLWLNDDLADGLPALICAPRGRCWWGEDACADAERLWMRRGGRVAVVPFMADDVQGDLAWGPDGTFVLGEGLLDPHVRAGVHVRARRDGFWSMPGVELPDGALDAELWPFRTGRGVFWRSEGWLYRKAERTTAVATLSPGDRVLAGPDGACLIGDGRRFVRGAAARRSAVNLHTAIDVGPWGVRWGDGMIAGLDGEDLVRVDLVTGRCVAREPGALPVDVAGTLSRREATCAFDGRFLAGPGGRLWDLVDGRALWDEPRLRLGATSFVGDRVLTVDWETGDGIWLAKNGAIVGQFSVPLAPDDVVAYAIGDVIVSAEGQAWRVGADLVGVDDPPPEVRHLRGDGFRITKAGLHTERLWPFPVEGAARVGGRLWAWNADGLLVALPSS